MALKRAEVNEEVKETVEAEQAEQLATHEPEQEVLPEQASPAPEAMDADGTSNALAAPKQTALAQQRESGLKQFLQEQAEQGFEDLEVGAFSFDRVKLHEGTFKLGSDEQDIGSKIQFVALSTRASYVVKRDSGEDAPMFYSNSADGSTKTDGSSAKETLDEWLEDGYGTKDQPLVISKYLEVTAELVAPGEDHDGAVVNLSIPPSSLQRFGGMTLMANRRFNAPLSMVVCEATVGAKIGEGKKSFRPWNFRVLNRVG